MTNVKFSDFNLSSDMLKAIDAMGFEEASPIQTKAIPLIMEGRDIIGQAHTGTGKTAAFGIPSIENLDSDSRELQLLVLCPTRELVVQVTEEFKKLVKYKKKISVVPVYGGQQIDRQFKALEKGAQVIIGTPGRTMDHMRRGTIDVSTLKTVVLDEADEMLDMGFREDIEFILKDSSESRQTVMFSATMDKDILELTKNYQNNPVIVNVVNERVNTPKIQQLYFEVMSKNKPELLTRLLDLHNIKLCLVFCNTKSQVDELVEFLKTRGYFAEGLHGDMSQSHRDKVMKGFRKGSIEILVATDVAGRGIDVNDVEAVFNYDLPRDDEDYVHRIGRTGRAGKTGRAFTFVSGKQVYNLKRIEKSNGIQIQRQNVPSVDDLQSTRIDAYASQIKDTIEAGHISKYVNQVELIMGEDFTSIDIAAALLKIVLEKEIENFDDSIDFEEIERKDFKNKEKRRDRDKYNKSNDGRRDRRERPKRDFKDKPKQNNSEKRWYERTFDAKTEDNETKTFSDRPKKKFEGKFEKDYSKDKKFRSKREDKFEFEPSFSDERPKKRFKKFDGDEEQGRRTFSDRPKKKFEGKFEKDYSKDRKDRPKREDKSEFEPSFSDERPKKRFKDSKKEFPSKTKKSYGSKKNDSSEKPKRKKF